MSFYLSPLDLQDSILRKQNIFFKDITGRIKTVLFNHPKLSPPLLYVKNVFILHYLRKQHSFYVNWIHRHGSCKAILLFYTFFQQMINSFLAADEDLGQAQARWRVKIHKSEKHTSKHQEWVCSFIICLLIVHPWWLMSLCRDGCEGAACKKHLWLRMEMRN